MPPIKFLHTILHLGTNFPEAHLRQIFITFFQKRKPLKSDKQLLYLIEIKDIKDGLNKLSNTHNHGLEVLICQLFSIKILAGLFS
jgi:hypothetical protein